MFVSPWWKSLNRHINCSPLPLTLTGGVFVLEMVVALRLTVPATAEEMSAHVATKAAEPFMMILESEVVQLVCVVPKAKKRKLAGVSRVGK